MEFRSFLLGLLICFLLSFLLGIERQFRRRFLGLRTMILVSVGSYLFVSFTFLLTGNGYTTDAGRVAAQVVAGIGFLGAGVIIKDNKNSKVRGLTTAATLWCDSSIGVLCAGGFIKEAIVASLVVLFSNVILRYINVFVNSKVEEKSILETFSVVFNAGVNNVDKVRENVIALITKIDYLETDCYEVDKGKLKIEIMVRKSDLLKLDKFIHKVVADYNISNYEFKKISESKIEDNEEL
jgi:putative Mg2+ transporter-C (MgtC) family protein